MKKVLKLLSVLLIIVCLSIGLAGCGDSDESSSSRKKSENSTSTEKSSSKADKSKVTIETVGTVASGDFVFKMTNDNDVNVYIDDVDVVFKDAEGNFAEKKNAMESYFVIPAHSTFINYVWAIGEDYSKYPAYEYEFELDEDYMSQYYVTEGIDVKGSDTGSQIAVTVTNNCGKTLDSTSVVVAFYKDGNIVACETGYDTSSIENEKSAYINVSYPDDLEYDDIDFDSFEVYLSGAQLDLE